MCGHLTVGSVAVGTECLNVAWELYDQRVTRGILEKGSENSELPSSKWQVCNLETFLLRTALGYVTDSGQVDLMRPAKN